jgi:hypothetical protein
MGVISGLAVRALQIAFLRIPPAKTKVGNQSVEHSLGRQSVDVAVSMGQNDCCVNRSVDVGLSGFAGQRQVR